MGMRIAEKKEVVKSLKEVVESSSALVASHYRGMSVSEMSNLRSKSRKKGVKLKIVKNTLAKKALVGSQYEGITDKLVGPIILAFSLEEPNTAAQLIQEFSKDCKTLSVQVIGLENRVFSADNLGKIAKMPNKKQAIAMLLGTLNGPVQKLACTLQETYAKLARTMQEVAKKRESQQ